MNKKKIFITLDVLLLLVFFGIYIRTKTISLHANLY